jgi:hypothetical protein
METAKERRALTDQTGLTPEGRDDYEALLKQEVTCQELGKRPTAETIAFDLDAEYETYCQPNGD